jgi:pseudouridylate synthase
VAELIRVHPDVAGALESRRAVVALETTLVAHGFPTGAGADVAREAEGRIREAGAVPATVGVVDGAIRVGLSPAELDRFASSPDARKVGPRDLAACVAQEALGATTVGGTLAVCRAVGIGFVATGGIGGVHRAYGERLDISADLGELVRTEAVVVCSGAKSVLDVDATAELLETLGVPVLGWRTDTFPRFYTADGGPPVSARIESAEEAADLARIHWRLARHSALVLARPSTESLDVDALVEDALAAAGRTGVRGGDVTPFLLAHVHEASGGRTIDVNRRLVSDNAALAAEVAVAYAASRPER